MTENGLYEVFHEKVQERMYSRIPTKSPHKEYAEKYKAETWQKIQNVGFKLSSNYHRDVCLLEEVTI